MPDYTDTTVNQLVFNVLTSAKYQELQNSSQINADQLYLITDDSGGGSGPSPYASNPAMDGTASPGSSSDYARGDHVHPTDTSRQAVLVSGTNIKTINNESILGSGNISISAGSSDVFIAEYGVTTYAEVVTASKAGKAVFAVREPSNEGYEVYALTSFAGTSSEPTYLFTQLEFGSSSVLYYITLSNTGWSPVSGVTLAPISSPTFTGTPKAPTATAGTNTTQIATTAFVQAALDSNFVVITGTVSNTNQVTIQKTPTEIYNYLNAGTSVYVKALYEGDNSYYPESAISIHRINSIKFEGNSGSQFYTIYVNSCPSYDSNSIAICEGYGAGNVSDSSITFSVKGVLYAPLASPNFTGNPTAPTQTAGNNSTRIATTAFVQGEKKNLVIDGDSSLDISSLADLKTQLSTWYSTIEDCSTAFFWFHVPTAFSLLTQGDKLVRLQRATSSWGFAEIFSDFGNSSSTMRTRYFGRSNIYMNFGNGTWLDPVPIRATLGNYYDYSNRPTDADTAVPFVQYDGGLYSFKATSSMTSNKPLSDGHIIHDTWDYTGNFSTQLFLPNATTNGTSDNGNRHVQVRGCYNGTWKTWESLAWVSDINDAIDNSDNIWTLSGGTAISSNADLDDYTTQGNYYCALNATAKTLLNTPWGTAASNSAMAFILKVIKPTTGTGTNMYVRQELYPYKSTTKYVRYTALDSPTNVSWQGWERIATTADINAAIGSALLSSY